MPIADLEGKVAVVTGAASGIGLALSEAFVEAGSRVVMADIADADLAREVERLRERGAEVIGIRCDVTDHADVERLADDA